MGSRERSGFSRQTWFLFAGGTEGIIGALSVTRDVTSRRLLNCETLFSCGLTTRPARCPTRRRLHKRLRNLLREHLRADRCSYAEIDVERASLTLQVITLVHLPSITWTLLASLVWREVRGSHEGR